MHIEIHKGSWRRNHQESIWALVSIKSHQYPSFIQTEVPETDRRTGFLSRNKYPLQSEWISVWQAGDVWAPDTNLDCFLRWQNARHSHILAGSDTAAVFYNLVCYSNCSLSNRCLIDLVEFHKALLTSRLTKNDQTLNHFSHKYSAARKWFITWNDVLSVGTYLVLTPCSHAKKEWKSALFCAFVLIKLCFKLFRCQL